MRILVCGGRMYNDDYKVFDTLNSICIEYGMCEAEGPYDHVLPCGVTIIQGGAKGADSLAKDWALLYGQDCETYSADWGKYGKSAGHIRNAEMLKACPDLIVAFPGGKGTENMVKQATKQGFKVRRIV